MSLHPWAACVQTTGWQRATTPFLTPALSSSASQAVARSMADASRRPTKSTRRLKDAVCGCASYTAPLRLSALLPLSHDSSTDIPHEEQ